MIKLFAHRGFVDDNIAENSIAALHRAYDLRFLGIEFDLWFIDNKFVIIHDKPNQEQLKDLPILGDFLHYQNQLYYWLDFKNLNSGNYVSALSFLKEQIAHYKIDLSQIYFVPYVTDYELAQNIHEELVKIFGNDIKFAAIFDDKNKRQDLLNFVKSNNIKYLSADHRLIDQSLIIDLSNVEILAWTVNDKKVYDKLIGLGIRNFATDSILPALS